ncbi:MAG: ribose 5-phosphate isomerase B [Cytophagaceae bacterium]|jgi:ribose 5-phosphate isomerase B|nr:ribose 5-phosphate isomerase B [Cytophagaceae bacterium]
MIFNKIALASDHAGYKMKVMLKTYLSEKGVETVDFGTYSAESVDYPDYAHPMAAAVGSGVCEAGIAICGSGNGINMTVNKHREIRAALCWMPEIAHLARAHNNANILSLPGRFITDEVAKKTVDLFLSTPFDGGRHTVRINKIAQYQ